MNTILNKEIQEAMKQNRFIPAKADGKLLHTKPKRGWTIILSDRETAKVLRDPTSAGDFTIEFESGETARKNTCNSDIAGYITNG